MTTRRRRTNSETGSEEPFISGRLSSILPVNQEGLNSYFVDQQVNFSSHCKLSENQSNALYKKHDVPIDFCARNQNEAFNQLNVNSPTILSSDQSFQAHSFGPPQYLIPNSPYSEGVVTSKWNETIDKSCKSLNTFSNAITPNKFQFESDVNELENMASRDRTQEFSRIIRSQQGSLANGAIQYKEGKKPKDFRQYAEFMQRAKLIGRNISSTYAKLEKLTHLAKKRSLFDDSQDQEIQELTGIIRHDLTSLTKQLEDVQSRSRMSMPSQNGYSGHIQKHSANLVGSLQTKVASITQKFKDVLEIRTENLKKQAQRREQYAGGIVSGELPPQAVAGHHQGSVLLADEAAAVAFVSNRNKQQGPNRTGDFSINIGNESPTETTIMEGAVGGGNLYQKQLHLMEEQDAYLQSRADTMMTIESTIVELGQMFTQLATMVKEQEEIVHRIDSNVDEAEMNVEAAHTELLKYFKSVSSNRWLMLKIFGVLIVFIVIFIVFMA